MSIPNVLPAGDAVGGAPFDKAELSIDHRPVACHSDRQNVRYVTIPGGRANVTGTTSERQDAS
ncbi:hypothetical protein GCM10010423_30530 [Streptomyces levis]|uniref:Uncharacterized protein n=1 Tax=Streptomyces levis TaxID=285566 RepID=A0ABN3NU61_9ACTN